MVASAAGTGTATAGAIIIEGVDPEGQHGLAGDVLAAGSVTTSVGAAIGAGVTQSENGMLIGAGIGGASELAVAAGRGVAARVEQRTRMKAIAEPKPVKAYRAQGRKLIEVDDLGNVAIKRVKGRRRRGVAVHIGFDETRAEQWIREKGRQEVVQFEVDANFLDRLRRTAQPEHGVVRDRSLPWKVDVAYKDQYAVPPPMLDELEAAIIPGSGKVHKP